MVDNEKIRTSKEFKELIDYFRAKCLLRGNKCASIPEITKIIAKTVDKDKIWQDGFNKR